LNDFLRQHARKSHEAGGAKTFLAIDDKDGKTVLGFYSLSPASVEYARTPDIVKRGLGRYDVPGFRLARLAVAKPFQGQGLGDQFLCQPVEIRINSRFGHAADAQPHHDFAAVPVRYDNPAQGHVLLRKRVLLNGKVLRSV